MGFNNINHIKNIIIINLVMVNKIKYKINNSLA